MEEASKYAAELFSLVVTQNKSLQDLQPITRELVADLYIQVCEGSCYDTDFNFLIIMGGLHQQNPEKQRGSLFCFGFLMNKVMMSMKQRTERPDISTEDKTLFEKAFSFIGLLSCICNCLLALSHFVYSNMHSVRGAKLLFYKSFIHAIFCLISANTLKDSKKLSLYLAACCCFSELARCGWCALIPEGKDEKDDISNTKRSFIQLLIGKIQSSKDNQKVFLNF